MSLSISFIGKFYNGKTRCIGSFVLTNGLNNSKLYMDQDDVMLILKVANMEKKSFNWCIENNKFKEITLYADYVGGTLKEKINIVKIDKETVTKYINKVNALNKEGIEKIYNRRFNTLADKEKEKVYLNWSIMQPMQKEEIRTAKFKTLTNENSRVDKYYNIIFNA